MRAYGFILFALLCAVLASGCSRSEIPAVEEQGVRLAFIVSDASDPWTREELVVAADSLERFEIDLFEIVASDDERLLEIIDLLPRRGVQGLLLCAPHPSIGSAVVAKAAARGIKLITVDTRLTDIDSEPLPVPFAGVSQSGAGRLLADSLLAQMSARNWPPDQVGILILDSQSSPEAEERIGAATKAFTDALLPISRTFLIASTDPDSLRDAVVSTVASTVAANPSLTKWLVFSADADSAFPALSALQDASVDSSSVIAGNVVVFPALPVFDSSTPDSLVASCFISPNRHGFLAAEHLYKWVKDSSAPPAEILSPGLIVTRDNFDELLNRITPLP